MGRIWSHLTKISREILRRWWQSRCTERSYLQPSAPRRAARVPLALGVGCLQPRRWNTRGNGLTQWGPQGQFIVLFGCLLLYLAALYVRPAEITPSLQNVAVVDILTVIGLFCIAGSLALRPRPVLHRSSDWFVAGFWSAIVLSNAAWGWFGGAWLGFLEFLPVLFTYVLLRIGIETPRQFKTVVGVVVALTVFQAVNGIVQYHTGVGLGGTELIQESRIRGTGIFNDPNDLGMMLVLATPFVLLRVFERGAKFRRRLFYTALLMPLGVAMYYTNSRGTLLGVGAVIMTASFISMRKVPATLIAAVGVAAILVLGPSRAGAIDAQEDSAQSRIEAWGAGLTMLKMNPVFGVGYGRFTDFHYRVAHNSWVHTFGELGLYGLFFFVGLVYFGFHNLKTLNTTSPPPQLDAVWWRSAMRCSLAGTLVCAFFLSRQYVVILYLLFGLTACLSDLTRSTGEAAESRDTVTHVGVILAQVAISIVAVWIMVRFLGAWA